MESPEDVKGNLVGQERVGGSDDGDPDGACDEDHTLAVDVRDAAPEQEEAAKSERVGRDDPLKPTLGNGEFLAYGGKNNDDGL